MLIMLLHLSLFDHYVVMMLCHMICGTHLRDLKHLVTWLGGRDDPLQSAPRQALTWTFELDLHT